MSNKIKIILGVALFSGLVFAAYTTKFYGDIDMQSHKISNLATPTANADATTKGYVDTAISGLSSVYLPRTGGTMSGTIYMGSTHQIKNLANPTASQDATTKSYVDTQTHTRLNKQGGQLFGTLDLQTNYIVRVHGPRSGSVGDLDAVNKYYVNNTFLPLTGGNLSGRLNMGGSYIDNVATPTNASQVATKNYVDGVALAKLPLSGGTMSGNINMNGHRLYGLASPMGDTDVATKQYVDNSNVNGSYYQYFALRKGSQYLPLCDLPQSDDTNLTVVILREFQGSITSYYENINASSLPNSTFPYKRYKVGETISVPFKMGADTYSKTNGTLVLKGNGGALLGSFIGNFGITAPPNGITPFTCEAIIGGNTYAPNTSVMLSGTSWDSGTKCFTFKIKNTSGRTITSTTLNASSVSQYVSSVNYNSTSLDCVETAQTIVVPNSMTIGGSWANNQELTFKLYIIDVDINNFGFRWSFQISADGSTYTFGQFFIPNAE